MSVRRFRPPQAVVFDMDGLLLDTEQRALQGFRHACSIHGVTLPLHR